MQFTTLTECFKGSWRDTGRALLNMPQLIVVIFLLMLAEEYARDSVQSTMAAAVSHSDKAVFALMMFAATLLAMIVGAILSVRIIRYALFGETRYSRDGSLRRYLLLSLMAAGGFVIFAIFIVLALVALNVLVEIGNVSDHARHRVFIVFAVIGVLALCGGLFLWVRLSLLFPHTAAGGQISWRSAWQATRSKFWAMLSLFILTTLPIVIISAALNFTSRHAGNFISGRLMHSILILLSAGASLLTTIIAAACSAWIYRLYATEMRRAEAIVVV
jgi:MFS family permease